MPEFNFLEGDEERPDLSRTGAGASRTPPPGGVRRVPDDLARAPQRTRPPQRPAPPAAQPPAQQASQPAAPLSTPQSGQQTPQQPIESAAPPSAPVQPAVPPGTPEEPTLAAQAAMLHAAKMRIASASGVTSAFPPVEHDPFADFDEEPVTSPGIPAVSYQKRSRWPLVVFGLVALVLIGASYVWFQNPYPPLRESIMKLFAGKKTAVMPQRQKPVTTAATAARADSVQTAQRADSAALKRDWDYFIQVSAWKELGTAQHEANTLRKRGLSIFVEGEFIPSHKGTYYRVRIGPFPTSQQAQKFLDSIRATIPQTAFIDSLRTEGGPLPKPVGPQIIQPSISGRSTSLKPASGGGKTAGAPSHGFAVKVSSYRSSQTASQEASRLLAKGFSAFVVKSRVEDVDWYRVYVGPFQTREDANRYSRLVSSTTGNDAFVVDFASPHR